MNITKDTCKELREALELELIRIGAHLGMQFTLGSMSFHAKAMHFRVDGVVSDTDVNESAGEAQFRAHAK